MALINNIVVLLVENLSAKIIQYDYFQSYLSFCFTEKEWWLFLYFLNLLCVIRSFWKNCFVTGIILKFIWKCFNTKANHFFNVSYISYNCNLILSVVFYLGAVVCFLRQPLQSRHSTTCSWVLPKYTNINLNINLLGISEHFPEESAKPGLHKGCG